MTLIWVEITMIGFQSKIDGNSIPAWKLLFCHEEIMAERHEIIQACS
jgi:hypothetical protein